MNLGLVADDDAGMRTAFEARILPRGMVFAPAALTPNLNRLSPASRLGQLFSLSAASHFLKALLPTAVIVYLAVGLIFVMLVPVPSFLLDILLALSITAAVLVLLSAIQILRPSQFSGFSSLLLFSNRFCPSWWCSRRSRCRPW